MVTSFELDGFEPIERIGGGGFGDVWLARQINVDRKVAVKVGHAPIQDNIIKLRFDRECKALGRLSGHPNIIDVYTAGTLGDGRPYLALEYIDGGTLWERLRRDSLSELDLCRLGEQISGALNVAHSAGVLHRDLKPENILMRSNGDAVLGDFGIARLQDGANTTSAAITASVAYAAPEVLGGTKASAASDLYGLGVCLLAAILQSVPFVDKDDDSIHPIINRVMSESHPQLRNRGLSTELTDVIDLLLDKTPERRPQSADEVLEVFQDLHYRRRREPSELRSGHGASVSRLSRRAESEEVFSGSAPVRLTSSPLATPVAEHTPSPAISGSSGSAGANSYRTGSAFGERSTPQSDTSATNPPWERSGAAGTPNRSISTTRRGKTDSDLGPLGYLSPKVRAFTGAYLLTLIVGLFLILVLSQIF